MNPEFRLCAILTICALGLIGVALTIPAIVYH